MTMTPEPAGYPHLGLSPLSFSVPHSPLASLPKLARRLEAWEAGNGMPRFQARHLNGLPPLAALELVSVYVSLRERYRTVKLDWLDFCADPYGPGRNEHGSLGWTWSYHQNIPAAYKAALALDTQSFRPRDVLDHNSRDRHVRTDARKTEFRIARDLRATGVMEINKHATHPRCLEEHLPCLPGSPGPDIATSELTYSIIHEFGHLVQSRLHTLGTDATAHVFGELSAAIFDLDRPPSLRSPARHLFNYYCDSHRWPQGPAAQKTRSRTTRQTVEELLGTYAASDREELFAEAFAFSYVVSSRQLRHSLRRFRLALADVGLSTRRRS